MKKFDSINVIPFIDIMLVLLAIVLTTATFISNGQLEIDLPEARSDGGNSNQESVEIAIDRQQTLFLDGKATSIEALETSLKTVDASQAVLLRIDETVPFNTFITVIDLLKQLNLENVSVLTEKTGKGAGESSGTDAVEESR